MIDQCIQLLTAMELYSMFSQTEDVSAAFGTEAHSDGTAPENTVQERMEKYE